jgi:hypothetical protein
MGRGIRTISDPDALKHQRKLLVRRFIRFWNLTYAPAALKWNYLDFIAYLSVTFSW